MKCFMCSNENERKITDDERECQILCESCCDGGSHCVLCQTIMDLLNKMNDIKRCGRCEYIYTCAGSGLTEEEISNNHKNECDVFRITKEKGNL
jgi:hypothetical protein